MCVIPHFELIALGSVGLTLFTIFPKNYEGQFAKKLWLFSHCVAAMTQASEWKYRWAWTLKTYSFLLVRFAVNIQECTFINSEQFVTCLFPSPSGSCESNWTKWGAVLYCSLSMSYCLYWEIVWEGICEETLILASLLPFRRKFI